MEHVSIRENDGAGIGHIIGRSLQRFISEDPIRFAGGINFFAYVENSPVMSTDPLGLCVLLGCTYGPLLQLEIEYGNWFFLFSKVLGAGPSVDCVWKRYNKITYGYVATCTYQCWGDCGKSYTYTTNELKKLAPIIKPEQKIVGINIPASVSPSVADIFCMSFGPPK